MSCQDPGVSEPTAQTSAEIAAQRTFEAELHLTTSDYREGLRQAASMQAFHWLAGVLAVTAVVLTVVGTEVTETEYTITLIGLPILGLGLLAWLIPELLTWYSWYASPARQGARLRLDAESISYVMEHVSTSYRWPLVRKAVETHSAFHLVIRLGATTAVCVLPKRAFLLEDHAAIRELITSKVGRLRQR